jgi:hypothetical protein
MIQPRQGIFFHVECEELHAYARVGSIVGEVILLLVRASGEVRRRSELIFGPRLLLVIGRRRGLGAFLGRLRGVMGVDAFLRRQAFAVALHILHVDEGEIERPTCSEFSKAADWSMTTWVGIDVIWSATGTRGANLSSDAFMLSILADSFSSSYFMLSLPP